MNAPLHIGRSRHRGFSLIEALIAVVVLATGLLALAALQGSLIRSSADAKARSHVAAFAQGLVDAGRIGGFNDPRLAPGSAANKLSTQAQRDAVAQAMGAATVSETTTVTQYIANAAGTFTGYTTQGAVDTALAANPSAATFKRVETELRWTDASGDPTPRVLRLGTDLSPLALTLSKVLVDRQPPDDSGLKPIVRRPLDPANEGMIPLALGDGQDTAATNPKPVLVGKKNDTLVSDTRFDVLTYNPTEPNVAGFARFNKRIETAVIGCECENGTGGFPTSGPDAAVNQFLLAAHYRPAFWDGERYAVPRRIMGGVTSSPKNSVSQSPLCDVCCRDHKDPAGLAADEPLYKPWPRTTELSHDHYRLDALGNPTVLAATGDYIEACRVIRVDGVWRVTPDPRLDDLAMVPTEAYAASMNFSAPVIDQAVATGPLVAASGRTRYTDFMFDFINGRYAGATPNTNFTDAERYTRQQTALLDEPKYVPLRATGTPPDKRWLHARGVFVDFLVDKARARLTKALEPANCPGAGSVAKAQCVLPYLPLATINVTELARWQGTEASLLNLINTTSYLPAPMNFAQARLRRQPSGIALFPAISPDEIPNTARLFDEQLMALVPNTTVRPGQWLAVSDTNGVIFGNLNNPTRGAATVAGGTNFAVNLGGIAAATNNAKGDDPVLVTVPVANFEQACTAASVNNTSNPFRCSWNSPTTGPLLGLSRFNYKVQPNQLQNTNPCVSGTNAPKVPRQATCVAHTLTSVSGDGLTTYTPSVSEWVLVSGNGGKPSAKRTLQLRNPVTAASVITLNFSSATTNATAVCDATGFVDWSCEL